MHKATSTLLKRSEQKQNPNTQYDEFNGASSEDDDNPALSDSWNKEQFIINKIKAAKSVKEDDDNDSEDDSDSSEGTEEIYGSDSDDDDNAQRPTHGQQMKIDIN